MAEYARQREDGGWEVGLPAAGTLSDGRPVSGYAMLDEKVLRDEGWMPVVDEAPEHDPNLQSPVLTGYEKKRGKAHAVYELRARDSSLTVDRDSIPADGETYATVTFCEPSLAGRGESITMQVNTEPYDVDVDDSGCAVLEVTSVHPGRVRVSTGPGRFVTINVEEV